MCMWTYTRHPRDRTRTQNLLYVAGVGDIFSPNKTDLSRALTPGTCLFGYVHVHVYEHVHDRMAQDPSLIHMRTRFQLVSEIKAR